MSAELVTFKSKASEWEAQVQADTVYMLEKWLADAKSGRYVAVAICGVLRSGEVETNVADHDEHPALVGAVTILQARLLRSVDPIPVE
jgi:hypothetical protein